MIKVKISSDIVITGLDKVIADKIKSALTLKNPMYEKLLRMGKFPGAKEFKYYTQEGDTLHIPRGCRRRLMGTLSKLHHESETDLIKIPLSENRDLLKLTLRDYQEKIIHDTLKEHDGVIHAATGTGKTVIGVNLIKELRITTTVLVPTKAILYQWVEECKKWLNYIPGIIGDGKKEIKDITIATYQTLVKNAGLRRELINNTSLLIIDEAHLAITKKRFNLVGMFKPSRLYGMTATLERTDEQEEAIEFLCGTVVAKFEATLLKPTVEIIYTGAEIPMAENYHEMVTSMIHNNDRNKCIRLYILGEMLQGRKIMVLTKRVEHYKILHRRLPDRHGVIMIDSDNPSSVTMLSDMKKGILDYQVILGTTNMLSTGVDIPSLDTLFLVGDIKSSVLTTQAIGRILRSMDGKAEPKVFDFFDHKNPVFRNQGYARRNLYKKKKWI